MLKTAYGVINKLSLLPVYNVFDLINWDYILNKNTQKLHIFLCVISVIISQILM